MDSGEREVASLALRLVDGRREQTMHATPIRRGCGSLDPRGQ